MKILALDDGELALELLTDAISEAMPSAEVFPFRKPTQLIAFAKEHQCDIAFLDIRMWGMNGLEVAKALKEICSKINIIFVTAYIKYMSEAFTVYPSGYVLKPVTKEAVERELENLRHPVDMKSTVKLYVQTFGNFEVFVNGKPLAFSRLKTKEMLAYLINRRGAECTNNEIVSVLWEEQTDSGSLQSYYRNLVADLSAVLKSLNAEEILIKKRGCLSIAADKIKCDYFDFYRGEAYAVNSYTGEYMAQYSWAEFTNGYL